MTTERTTLLDDFLCRFTSDDWASAVAALLPSIHAVDRTATRIWFAFFPLALRLALDEWDDPEELARRLLLAGTYRLEDRIDSSHVFLYGHRYWPEVRRAILEALPPDQQPFARDLESLARELAARAAARCKTDVSLLVGITVVGLMTVRQVGSARFAPVPGEVHLPPAVLRQTPDQVLGARAKDDSQGLFGFLKGLRKEWTITFNEMDPEATFALINSQALTTAAANDKRDYRSRDPRCFVGEGPIPVECRTAVCGMCWVGVLGGADKLSAVDPLERRRIAEFGYADTDESRPIIRLACMAHAFGAVSIVIPPWNGQFGKCLKARRDEEARTDAAEEEAAGS